MAEHDDRARGRTHNVMSGQAANVVQVGSADAIYLSPSTDARGTPTTRPVAECTPLDLEVHRSIEAAHDPSLTTYVPRLHDEALRQLVDHAADGHSGLAVLVAGSSTGKTRACWEAIQGLPENWRLWHPINPGRPEAALAELAGIEPHTVVWLNESHHYLLTRGDPLGEQVAAGLRELLRDPARGPVLVLGTLWPEYLAVLSQLPSAGMADQHTQARDLLTGRTLHVPETFTQADVSVALQSGDQRLWEAVELGHERQVIQYLAGGPVLVERYEHAPPAARAVLTAAADARRLGHGLQLSRELLRDAAPDYLTDAQWSRLEDDWFDRALAYCLEMCRGGSSPLVPVRARTRGATVATVFRLEDYLEQHARQRRAHVVAPASLWQALLDHAPTEQLATIGIEARNRGLYRIAYEAYVRVGNGESLRKAAMLLERSGQPSRAADLYRRAIDAGDLSSLERWAALVDIADAIAMYRGLVERHGSPVARRRVVAMRVIPPPANEPFDIDAGPATLPSSPSALRLQVEELIQHGRVDDAIERLRSVAESGGYGAESMLTMLLAATGNPPIDDPVSPDQAFSRKMTALEREGRFMEALEEYRAAAELGDTRAMFRAMFVCHLLGDLARVMPWLRARTDSGDLLAMRLLAETLARLDDRHEAVEWYLRVAETGNASALVPAAKLMRELGEVEAADNLTRYGLEPGGKVAISWP